MRDPDAPRPVPPPSPLQAHHVARGVAFEKLEHTLNRRLQRTHKPFDLHGLYLAVTSRGGFLDRPKARKNLSMVEVFRDMENHYDRHTYTDIGTLLLNTYEQTFLEYEREHPQDLNIIACPTCARSPPRRERRARASGGASRSRDDPPPFAREGVARGEPPNALGWVECDACRVLTHVDCARAGAADLTPGGNVAWFVCDACDETSSGNARRTPPSNVAGTTDAGTRSVGAGVEKRRKRSRDDVRSRRPAPRSIGDDVRAASAAAAAAVAAAAADGRRTFDPRLAEAATRFVAEDAARRRTGAKPGAVDAVLGTAGFGDGAARGAGEDGEDAVMVPAPGWLPWSVADVLHGERDGSPRRAFVPLVRNASLTPRPWGVDVPRSDSQCSLDVFGILLDADASASSPLGPAA